jgi:hypothetical protein
MAVAVCVWVCVVCVCARKLTPQSAVSVRCTGCTGCIVVTDVKRRRRSRRKRLCLDRSVKSVRQTGSSSQSCRLDDLGPLPVELHRVLLMGFPFAL